MRAKLSPRYIRPYEIIKKLNRLAYWLDLPVELEQVHNVFRISQLKKYTRDPNHAVVTKPTEATADLVYEEHPLQILDCRIK